MTKIIIIINFFIIWIRILIWIIYIFVTCHNIYISNCYTIIISSIFFFILFVSPKINKINIIENNNNIFNFFYFLFTFFKILLLLYDIVIISFLKKSSKLHKSLSYRLLFSCTTIHMIINTCKIFPLSLFFSFIFILIHVSFSFFVFSSWSYGYVNQMDFLFSFVILLFL